MPQEQRGQYAALARQRCRARRSWAGSGLAASCVVRTSGCGSYCGFVVVRIRSDGQHGMKLSTTSSHFVGLRMDGRWRSVGILVLLLCCSVEGTHCSVYRAPSRCVKESLPSNRRRGGPVQLHGRRVLTQPAPVWGERHMHAVGHPKRSCAAPV